MKKKMIITLSVNGLILVLLMSILTIILVNDKPKPLKHNSVIIPITVTGAVNKPQTFYCQKGQTLRDVSMCFGGFDNDADINDELLNKQLMQKEVIYIKRAKPININKATYEDLFKLKINEEDIKKILQYTANKKLVTKEELVSRELVTKEIFIKIKDRITL